MNFNLSNPIPNIIEALFRCTVIGKNDAHCSFVISLSNGSKSLLTCSVPNLQFNIFPSMLIVLILKSIPIGDSVRTSKSTYGRDVRGGKIIIGKSKKETSFANSRVSYQN